MPKTRTVISRGNKAVPKQVSFKIGGRKNAVSALLLTEQELIDTYNKSSTRGRDKVKLIQVAHIKGYTL